MKCEKCGTELEPTGDLLAGFPFMGCPKCGDKETKAKIKSHRRFMEGVKSVINHNRKVFDSLAKS